MSSQPRIRRSVSQPVTPYTRRKYPSLGSPRPFETPGAPLRNPCAINDDVLGRHVDLYNSSSYSNYTILEEHHCAQLSLSNSNQNSTVVDPIPPNGDGIDDKGNQAPAVPEAMQRMDTSGRGPG